jgi:amidase
LRAAGAEVVDPVEIAGMKELNNAEFEVLLYEFKDGLNAYFASLWVRMRRCKVAGSA